MHTVRTKGFTIVELIVVIGLIAGLTGFFVNSAIRTQNVTQLDEAARELEALILQAQAWGQSGRAAADETDPDRFDYGFGVFLADGADEVIFYRGAGIEQGNESRYLNAGTQYVRTHKLKGGVTVDWLCVNTTDTTSTCGSGNTNEGHVHTRRGDRVMNIYRNNTSDQNYIVISLTNAGLNRDLVVWKSGLIHFR